MASKITLSDFILQLLNKHSASYLKLEDFTAKGYLSARGYEKPLKKNTLIQAIRRLHISGYLRVEKLNGEKILRLTDEGKNKLYMQNVLDDKPWDGKWRIVIFDIPEQYRKARNILRTQLKAWEFEPWQRSVWASQRNVTEPLRKFIRQMGIERWVKVIEASNVG